MNTVTTTTARRPFQLNPYFVAILLVFVALAIFSAMLLQRIRKQNVIVASLLLALLVGYNVAGTLVAAAKNPPGITTQFDPVTWIDHTRDQELIDFLLVNGETRGYTNYWVAYPLAFASQEDLIFTPSLNFSAEIMRSWDASLGSSVSNDVKGRPERRERAAAQLPAQRVIQSGRIGFEAFTTGLGKLQHLLQGLGFAADDRHSQCPSDVFRRRFFGDGGPTLRRSRGRRDCRWRWTQLCGGQRRSAVLGQKQLRSAR